MAFRRRCQCCHLGLGLPCVTEDEWMMEMISRRRKNEKTAEQIGPETDSGSSHSRTQLHGYHVECRLDACLSFLKIFEGLGTDVGGQSESRT